MSFFVTIYGQFSAALLLSVLELPYGDTMLRSDLSSRAMRCSGFIIEDGHKNITIPTVAMFVT